MDELVNFQLSGNIIHSTWFKTITRNGKADLLAINLLAEIVYWYKPYEVRDEATGQHIAWKKKYKGDLLQKSYANLAEQFGISERQVKAGIVRLEELGVITRVFRTIIANGVTLNNVLYIQLNIERLKEISEYPVQSPCDKNLLEGGQNFVIPLAKKCNTPDQEKSEGGQKSDTPIAQNCHTNTEITTEITTKTTTEITNNKNIQSEIVCDSKESPDDITKIIEQWNQNKYLPRISKLLPRTERYKMLKARMKDYSLEDILKAIDNITKSDFLQGKVVGKNGKVFHLTFDWFIRPNNFPKILEGNYDNDGFKKICHESNSRINQFNNMDSHEWDFDEIERLEREYIDKKLENGG